MACARMRKVTILAYRELLNPLLERLRDLEVLHLTRTSELDSSLLGEEHGPPREGSSEVTSRTCEDYAEKLSQLSYIRSYFEKYNPPKKGLIEMFTGAKPEVTPEEFDKAVREYDVSWVFSRVKSLEEQEKCIDEELARVQEHIELLRPWRSLDVPLDKLGETRTAVTFLAVVPVSSWEGCVQDLSSRPVAWEEIWRQRSACGLWVACASSEASYVRSLIASCDGTVLDLAGMPGYRFEGLVSDVLKELEGCQERLLQQKEAIRDESLKLSQDLVKVLSLLDYYSDLKNLTEVGNRIKQTRFTLVIEGYVRAKDMPRLRDGLREFKAIEILDEEPGPDDDVPVYLENHPLIRPFEVVTNIYGYPKYNEIDPTPILAPFFWVFFGLCLADAVYGIALSVGAWYFLRTRKLAEGGQKLVKLLMYCGLSTFLFGALTGSWMGDLALVFFRGTAFERLVTSLTVLSPIDDPLTLLLISFALGIFQVWVGIVVKMVATICQGQVMEAILSSGSWIILIPGLLGVLAAKAGLIHSNVSLYIALVGALMVMYSSSRGQRNILLKPFTGLYGLYSIVGYFSDTMSYSRLLALGLAGAVIGVVVNKIAELAFKMLPVVGFVMAPVVVLGGHLFNMVINVLGSFIHSGRLQFVEFFTKFFEGGGKPFRPLRRLTDNVFIQTQD